MKKLLWIVCVLLCGSHANAASIVGTLTNEITKKPLEGVSLLLVGPTGEWDAFTDDKGAYSFAGLNAGSYTLSIIYAAKELKKYEDITLIQDEMKVMDIQCLLNLDLPTIVVLGSPLIEPGEPTGLIKIKARDIDNSPRKNIADLISVFAGGYQKEDGKLPQMHGTRQGSMAVYVDGVRMEEAPNIPTYAIKSMAIYTADLPAKYGDCVGGVVAIDTKTYFDIYREHKNKQNN